MAIDKLDSGKLQMGHYIGCFSRALEAIVMVMEYGERKYAKDNWMTIPDGVQRYEDATLRHFMQRKGGEYLDSESGLPHHFHEVASHLISFELWLREQELDDE